VANNEKEASHLMSHLDWDEALIELQNAVNWLKEEKKVQRVTVMGFCMGGALSIAAGARLKNLDGGVCFYGVPPETVAHPKDIKCSMQFHFGDLDECKGFSDQEKANAVEEAVKEAGIHYEFHRYPNCKHAFMNQMRPNYSKDNADVAFDRVLSFLKTL
jgi:carboxymethylenebutenolidase